MSNDTLNDGGRTGLTRALRTMPKWKVGLLVGSLVLGVLGCGAYLTSRNLRRPETVTMQVTTPNHPGTGAIPGGGSGFVGGSGPGTADQTQTQTVTTTAMPPPSWTEQYTPIAAKIGFSFFVGLIAGTVSRVFIKFAALLAGLVVAAVAAAHHFNINLDLNHVQTETGQATTWLHGQLDQLWGVVKEHLPSAGSATAGFLFGLKRR